MKGNGNLSGRSLKRIKGLTGFVILSHLKESTFTAVKKGCKVLNLVCERGKGLNLGEGPPRIKLCYLPPGPRSIKSTIRTLGGGALWDNEAPLCTGGKSHKKKERERDKERERTKDRKKERKKGRKKERKKEGKESASGVGHRSACFAPRFVLFCFVFFAVTFRFPFSPFSQRVF